MTDHRILVLLQMTGNYFVYCLTFRGCNSHFCFILHFNISFVFYNKAIHLSVAPAVQEHVVHGKIMEKLLDQMKAETEGISQRTLYNHSNSASTFTWKVHHDKQLSLYL